MRVDVITARRCVAARLIVTYVAQKMHVDVTSCLFPFYRGHKWKYARGGERGDRGKVRKPRQTPCIDEKWSQCNRVSQQPLFPSVSWNDPFSRK